MWYSASSTIRLTVEALDQKYLFGSKTRSVVPLVALVVFDAVRLTVTSRVDETTDDKIGLLHRIRLRDRKGITLDSLDGSPDVDDLHTAFHQLIGLVGKMVGDARERRLVGLINVHLLNGTTKGRRIGCPSTAATDSVIENEDAIGAGSSFRS